MTGTPQRPGEVPQRPAEYQERGPLGGHIPKPREVTIQPGDPKLPPTQKPNRTWVPIGPPKRGRRQG
jgi:hypothetical protein